MHLILGGPEDPCCQGVFALLEARGFPTRIISNPLEHPSRFTWRLDNEQSASQLAWDEEPPVTDDQLAGLFVRRTGWLDPDGWQLEDLAYMQAETQAALLGWLWSLACPVVNRYPSAIWYRSQVSLLSWQPLLRRCGLPTLETLVTNVEHEARAFGQRQAQGGMPSAVYGPLTSNVRYLVADDTDWNGLAAMQKCAPVCLTYPHGEAIFCCVVGDQVVWEGDVSNEATQLETALRRFAMATGLTFVELALAPAPNGICVIAVEPHPHFDHFGATAQKQIVEGIVHLLTAYTSYRQEAASQQLVRAQS